MPSVVGIIQCRLGSSRLPNKALADLNGKPMIAHVLQRALAIHGLDDVIVAVPDQATKAALAGVGIPSFATPNVAESNVLARFATIACQFASHDTILRLTGDCPLLDPAIAEAVLDLYHVSGRPYAWNDTAVSGWPDGTDVEVFSRDLLLQAHATATDPYDLEHVTPAIRRGVAVATLPAPEDLAQLKISVDDEADLETVRAIMAKLPKGEYALAATLKAAGL